MLGGGGQVWQPLVCLLAGGDGGAGFSLQIIKAKVLEVDDKLLIYIQHVVLYVWERQLGETAVQSA